MNSLEAFSPLVGLVVNILAHIMVFRYCIRVGLLKSIAIGFAAGLFATVALDLWNNGSSIYGYVERGASIFADILVYAALGYGYFAFINLIVCSMRIRMLMELFEADDGLSEEEILGRYNGEEQIELRIRRLLGSGQVLFKDGRYYLNKRGMLLASRIISIVRMAVLGKRRGLGND